MLEQSASRTVVGFNGMPVENAAGVKAPILRFDDTGLYGSAELPGRYDEAEIADYEQRCILCRTVCSWPAVDDGVIVYATSEFLVPRKDGYHIDTASMLFDERLRVYVNYRPYKEVMEQFGAWSKMLLIDAYLALHAIALVGDKMRVEAKSFALRRVTSDALRVRTCTASLPGNDASRGLREEAFACAFAVLRVEGSSEEALLLDAAFEFSPAVIERIRKRSEMLLRDDAACP